MSSKLGSHLPILEKDLAVQRATAGGLIASVDWAPKVQLTSMNGGTKEFQAGTKAWRSSTVTSDIKRVDKLSLVGIGKLLSQDANLMSEDVNYVLLTLREAICIGLHLGQQYYKASGIRELQSGNSTGQLSSEQRTEFSVKMNTASAVTLFCTAAYVVWRLGSYKEDKVSAVQVEFHGVPEVDLTTPASAMKCFTFYLAGYLDPERTGLVKTDLAMVRMVTRYCEAMLDEIKTREPSLKYAEPFTNVSYQLDDSDFVVSGFDLLRHTVAVSAEFKRVDFNEIVGNQAAKHAARRLASRLACYDLKKKSNPFAELGGLQTIWMGFGKPGTGKTMSIAATATEIDRLCSIVGLPFLFWPLPDNIISTFQGGSGERMLDWTKRFADQDKIVYGTIDDGENNFEDRTRQNVSAGVREVIGVFLRATEGASAVWRGNSVIAIYTNLPEQLDKAVLSRVQARYPIDGAVSLHDLIDQDYFWWRRLANIDPKFIDMKDLPDYKYMSDQVLLKSMADASKPVGELNDERLREIYRTVSDRYKISDHAFYAAMYFGVMKVFPMFSSRDVRNIQQAVQSRIIDFDLPDEWLERPELFYHQPYETKVSMLKGLMRDNMKKVSFAEIRHEEMLRYLNAMVMIASADRERQIKQVIDNVEINQAARGRLVDGQKI